MKIAHLTSVHSRYDTRIFSKECRSLAVSGQDVTLIVADGQGNGRQDGVAIIDVGRTRGRLSRMLFTPQRIYAKALALDADVYHLHDPELIPVGLRLRKSKLVIFDSHEDIPADILDKQYLSPAARHIVSALYARYERYALARFDQLIGATPSITARLSAINANAININNFPILGELDPSDTAWDNKRREICYVGDLTAIRGIAELVSAMGMLSSDVVLSLGGKFSNPALRNTCLTLRGWARVKELGYLNRAQVREVTGRAIAGVVTFLPAANHLCAQPNKMFEYMASGIPVIASNFPLWRRLIEETQAGICVDPQSPTAIAAAIDRLAADPAQARKMGENGRQAVARSFNWAPDEIKLLQTYDALLAR